MAVDERTRRELYTAFEESWDSDRAEALMSLLPPVGWGDVATRPDLESLRQSLDARLTTEVATLRTEMAELRTGLRRDLVTAT